jgi:glutaredoxin
MVLYSTENCPRCKMLKMKLAKKNIEYEEVSDIEILLSKGIKQAPMLEVDGELLNLSKANDYINSL